MLFFTTLLKMFCLKSEPEKWGRKMKNLLKAKKGMLGVESAIILIAFVIVAAAFSFMVVNMGLFATQRGRSVIQQGIQEASTPLMLDGSIMIRGTSSNKVDAIIIPLAAFL